MADDHETTPDEPGEPQELSDDDLDEVAGGTNGVAMGPDLSQT